jgi:hypothetical protein
MWEVSRFRMFRFCCKVLSLRLNSVNALTFILKWKIFQTGFKETVKRQITSVKSEWFKMIGYNLPLCQ